MHKPRDPDAEQIEDDHRSSKDAHVQDVGSRRDDCCNYEYDEDGITQIAPEPTRGNNPHQCQKEDENRQLKDNSQTNNQYNKEIGVFANGDHRLELLSLINQEIERRRIDDFETEETS